MDAQDLEYCRDIARQLVEAMNRFEMNDPAYLEALPVVGRLKGALPAAGSNQASDPGELQQAVGQAELWLERHCGPVDCPTLPTRRTDTPEAAGEFALLFGQIHGYEFMAAGENPQHWTVACERLQQLVEGSFRSYGGKQTLWSAEGFQTRFSSSREALLAGVFVSLRLTLFNIEQNPLQKLFKLRFGLDAGEDYSDDPGAPGSRIAQARQTARRLAERVRFLDEKNIFGRLLLSEDAFQSLRMEKNVFRVLDITKQRFEAEPARGLPAEFAYRVLFL